MVRCEWTDVIIVTVIVMMYLFCMYRRCVNCYVRISIIALFVVVREGVCCCVGKMLCLGILLCCILSVFVEPNVRKGLCVCVCVF